MAALFFPKKKPKLSIEIDKKNAPVYEKFLSEIDFEYEFSEDENGYFILIPEKQKSKFEEIHSQIKQYIHDEKVDRKELSVSDIDQFGIENILYMIDEGIIKIEMQGKNPIICLKNKNRKAFEQIKNSVKPEQKSNQLDSKIFGANKIRNENAVQTVLISIERHLKNELDNLLDGNISLRFHKWIDTDEDLKIQIYADKKSDFYFCYLIAKTKFDEAHSAAEAILKAEKHKAIDPKDAKHPEDIEKKKRKNNGRTASMIIRITPEEKEKIQEDIKKSGHKQSDYLREQVLNGCIKELPHTVEQLEAIQTLRELTKEMGRVEGMIAKTIRINEEMHAISPAELEELKAENKELKKLKNEIRKAFRAWNS